MFDKSSGARALPTLTAVLVLMLVLAAGSLYFTSSPLSNDRHLGGAVATLGMIARAVPQQAMAAVRGDVGAFDALAGSRLELRGLQDTIASDSSLTAAVGAYPELQSGTTRLAGMGEDVDAILAARQQTLVAHAAAREVATDMPNVLVDIGNLGGILGTARWAELGRHVERFELAGQRLQMDTEALALGVGDLEAAAGRLADDEAYLSLGLRGLAGAENGLGIKPVTGAEATRQLRQVEERYRPIGEHVRAVISASEALVAGHSASIRLAAEGAVLSSELSGVGIAGGTIGVPVRSRLPFYLLLGALVMVAAMIALYYWAADRRRAAHIQSQANERNQEAILTLLDELGSLADGDLTVQATVTEDITGAIADSINYAIEALRELVTTINDTAVMVDAATKQTQATARHLAKASETQSKQVAAATESIAQMAASVEEVSGNAERCSDVARHSVDVAHKGGEAVRRTIDGMNTIRETIQETSKRIKRLGESSQEIGNIVELINDIAEQTNILALNASIQASMAGEAGRGFAVVADEVQRLAERSANATKQIEVLVRTIQADTNEAVVSMERSTTDVVGGALLAENAGAALEEIEQVSNQIASLVQNISSSARQQATAAADISRNTGVLREISSQTAEGTSATSASISKLAELATQLRKSVAGFRLPDFATGTAVIRDPDVATASAGGQPRVVPNIRSVAERKEVV